MFDYNQCSKSPKKWVHSTSTQGTQFGGFLEKSGFLRLKYATLTQVWVTGWTRSKILLGAGWPRLKISLGAGWIFRTLITITI
jgi:hypothetical protein